MNSIWVVYWTGVWITFFLLCILLDKDDVAEDVKAEQQVSLPTAVNAAIIALPWFVTVPMIIFYGVYFSIRKRK